MTKHEKNLEIIKAAIEAQGFTANIVDEWGTNVVEYYDPKADGNWDFPASYETIYDSIPFDVRAGGSVDGDGNVVIKAEQ